MVKLAVKILFSFGIIYYLIQRGLLDFSLVTKILQHPILLIISATLLLSNLVLISYRWRYILYKESTQKISLFETIKINWIGCYFSTVLPGAVTGDLVKLFYAQSLDPKLSRSFLLSSIFFDRLLGVSGLVLISGFVSLFSYQELTTLAPRLTQVIHFNFFLCGAILLFFTTFMAGKRWQHLLIHTCAQIPLVGHKLSHLMTNVWSIGSDRKIVFASLLMSVVVQMSGIAAFWILTHPFIHQPFSFLQACTLVPIGFITLAIPISPAGIGVGHAMFAFLLGLIQITQGASVFNIFFLLSLMINLLGMIPYLMMSKRPGPLLWTKEELK